MSITGYAGRKVPFSISVTLNILCLHAAKLAFSGCLRITRYFHAPPGMRN